MLHKKDPLDFRNKTCLNMKLVKTAAPSPSDGGNHGGGGNGGGVGGDGGGDNGDGDGGDGEKKDVLKT